MKFPVLYKRSNSNNKISQWEVEVEGNKFRTISGFTNGEKVTSEWTCCEAKSYNTANQQAEAEATAMHTKRKALGYWEDIKDIDTHVYFKPMLANDYNDYKDKIKFPIYSQPKLDGVRCIIRSDGMWSRNGKPIISAPHIFESLKPLFEQNPDLILDGELYTNKFANDFNKIISLVKKIKPTADDLKESKELIEYHIYDLPSSNKNFVHRAYDLAILFETRSELHPYCRIVETYKVSSEDVVTELYKKYVEKGYEGQMLRLDSKYENKRSKSLLKHKLFFDEEFEILGYEEGKGNLSGKLGKLKFKTKNGIEFDAAVNGTWDYLTELWSQRNDLIGKQATVKYFEYTEDGSLRFPKVINIGREDYE
jgi:ATP-dependent DNA ligase